MHAAGQPGPGRGSPRNRPRQVDRRPPARFVPTHQPANGPEPSARRPEIGSTTGRRAHARAWAWAPGATRSENCPRGRTRTKARRSRAGETVPKKLGTQASVPSHSKRNSKALRSSVDRNRRLRRPSAYVRSMFGRSITEHHPNVKLSAKFFSEAGALTGSRWVSGWF